jgi:hypothetical protein
MTQNIGKISSELPEYLEDFVCTTPTGATKLIEVWDDLCIESQIQLVHKLAKSSDFLKSSNHVTQRVFGKILKSSNAYVRYLAAHTFDIGENLKKLIEEDPSSLVRFSSFEINGPLDGFMAFENPASFYSLPQEARLAKIRNLTSFETEALASLFEYALKQKEKQAIITDDELFELLLECFNKPDFNVPIKNGFSRYGAEKGLGKLWNMIPEMPLACKAIMLYRMPLTIKDPLLSDLRNLESSPLTDDEISKLLEKLKVEPPRLLEFLLYRKDIGLKEHRKKIFWNHMLDENNRIVNAAVSLNFDLTYEEFAQILEKPEKEKTQILKLLLAATDLSLCLYEAVADVLTNNKNASTVLEVYEPRQTIRERLLELSKKDNDFPSLCQGRQLKLYRLAKQIAPWGKEDGCELREELKFLNECIVKGDTWKTFMAFSKAWESIYWREAENLKKNLPGINEIDDEPDKEEEKDTDSNQMIINEIVKLKTTVEQEKEGKNTDSNQIIINELVQLKTTIKGYKILLYIMIGLLIYLFLHLVF